MFKEVTKQYYIDNVYPLDVVSFRSEITWEKDRWCHHPIRTRGGDLVGKTVSDNWGIEETKYYEWEGK